MHKNRIWILFLSIVSFVLLWFSWKAFFNLYQYTSLTASTKTSSIHWIIEQKASDKFYVQARYTFVVDGKNGHGQTTFTKHLYRNRSATEQAISNPSNDPWNVWYNPSNLNHSTLQKKFPFKECLYAAIVWGVFIYFICLGIYVGKKYETDRA